mmetsp:Transcript_64779/g.189999  ORF Transcript_64779/g.189999 Transcript_64779/m.189999 type:complete len:349 (+) Transcript_64779:476-1522(+)
MRLRHAHADGGHVARPERLDARVHPLVLADDVLGALVLRCAQGAAVLRKAGAVDVAQVRHLGVAGSLRDALARGEAVGPQLRVLAVDELVRRVRVREDELRAGEGRVAVVQRAAVEVEEIPSFSEARAELVKDAAAHPHEVVFGRLRGLDLGELVQLANRVREEPPEEVGGRHLDGSGAGHASARRDIRGHESIKAAHLDVQLQELADDADDVVRPGLVAGLLVGVHRLAHIELHHLREGLRGDAAHRGIRRLAGDDHVPVNRTGKDVALVVVCVVPEDLCAAGSDAERHGSRSEGVGEALHRSVPELCRWRGGRAGRAEEAAHVATCPARAVVWRKVLGLARVFEYT